jgi:orotidine-5'-phosphate decarboxylase
LTSDKTSPRAYKDWIFKTSKARRSRVILAIDLFEGPPEKILNASNRLLARTISNLCGVKLGRQTVLSLGRQRTQRLTRLAHSYDIPCLIDDKLNDIGETNEAIAQTYFQLGFDSITANPFVGQSGLRPLFRTAHRDRKGIILLTYMSHPSSFEGYGQRVLPKGKTIPEFQYRLFARQSLKWGADGVVVGATYPNIVREVKSILHGKVPIYSPGVGTQGGRLNEARRAGTDYFIIGRSITRASKPDSAAANFARASFAKA